MGVRQGAPLLPAAPQPDAPEAPRGQRHHRVDRLVAGAVGIGQGVDEVEEPVDPVRCGGDEQHERDAEERGTRGDELAGQAHGPEHPEDHREQDEGRAQVLLQHDERGDGPREGHDRHQHRVRGASTVQRLLTVRVQGRDPDDDGQLGELRRLQAETGREREPVAVAAHLEDREEPLLHDDPVRAAARAEGEHRARAQDHDEAESHEQRGGTEHELVGRQGTLEHAAQRLGGATVGDGAHAVLTRCCSRVGAPGGRGVRSGRARQVRVWRRTAAANASPRWA